MTHKKQLQRPVTWAELCECMDQSIFKSDGDKKPTLSSRLLDVETRLSVLEEKLNRPSIFTRFLSIFRQSRGRAKYERIVSFRDFSFFQSQDEASQRNSQKPPIQDL